MVPKLHIDAALAALRVEVCARPPNQIAGML
jgi:hypothetical protein